MILGTVWKKLEKSQVTINALTSHPVYKISSIYSKVKYNSKSLLKHKTCNNISIHFQNTIGTLQNRIFY